MPLKIIEREKFDPEGAGYDYQTALEYGLRPDETGHWDSRIPQTGMLLKGRGHPTWDKTVLGEKKAGYQIIKVGKRYISIPKSTLRANVPLPIRQGLVSPGLKKAYREILGEFAKGVEPPERDITLTGEEGLPTGIARLLKLYTLDIPGSFLKRGGEALESPDTLTSEDLLRLAGEATLFGMGGAGRGVAGMGVRKLPKKPFFDPLSKALLKDLEKRFKTAPETLGTEARKKLTELRLEATRAREPELTRMDRILKTMKRERLTKELDQEFTASGGFKTALPSQKRKIIKLIQEKHRLLEEL